MNRVGTLARVDTLLAWRRGVIGSAVAVVVIYVILLRVVAGTVAATLLPYLVFSDPAALGFFFVGGIVLAERAEGVVAAVSTSPVEPWEMVVGRVGVLAAIGSAGGLAVGLGSGLDVEWLTFAPAVILTALLYSCFGYAVAMRAGSVNEYFARAAGWSIPLFAPLAAFALDPEHWVLTLWPPTASLILLRGGTGTGRSLLALSVLAVAALVVGRWAVAELKAARREGRS